MQVLLVTSQAPPRMPCFFDCCREICPAPLRTRLEGVRENKHMLISAASVEHAEATPRPPEKCSETLPIAPLGLSLCSASTADLRDVAIWNTKKGLIEWRHKQTQATVHVHTQTVFQTNIIHLNFDLFAISLLANVGLCVQHVCTW